MGPPDDGYPIVAQSGLLYENDSREEAWSPSRKLEDAVARLQQDIADYRKELRFSGVQGPANPSRPTKWSGFTSTPVPIFRAVGPMRPLVTAAPLGGARGHNDGMLQVNSLSGFLDCGGPPWDVLCAVG